MADWERKQVNSCRSRGGVVIEGRAALWFAAPFVLFGAMTILSAGGVLQGPSDKYHAPRWMALAFGLLCTAFGFWLSGHWRRGLGWEAERVRRSMEGRWMSDFRWDPKGRQSENEISLRRRTIVAVAICLGITGAVIPALRSGEAAPLGTVILLGILAALLIQPFRTAMAWIRHRWHGGSRVEFGRFPFLLGEKAELRFKTAKHINADAFRFTLRFIEEELQVTRSGDGDTTRVLCHQVYADALERRADHSNRHRGLEFAVEFDLPAKAELATRLSDTPAAYWELEVFAPTDRLDFKAAFLIPVYAG